MSTRDPMVTARPCEIARFVDDVDGHVQFYERLLGRPPHHHGPDAAVWDLGGVTLLIHRTFAPGPGDPPCEDHTALAVDELDDAVETLSGRGLTISHPPRSYPWGRSAYLRDPSGRLIELIERSL